MKERVHSRGVSGKLRKEFGVDRPYRIPLLRRAEENAQGKELGGAALEPNPALGGVGHH